MRKAIDWETGLSEALAASGEGRLLENTGYCGSSGSTVNFPSKNRDFPLTTGEARLTSDPRVVQKAAAITTDNQSGQHQVGGFGYQETLQLQAFTAQLTTLTTLTTEIEQAERERAAIIEFDAGIPRPWAEGFARLDCRQPLAGYSETQWRQIIDDGGRLLDQWGERAARLSWQATDMFGLDPRAPRHRYDAMGLVFLIGGGRVVALEPSSATIERGTSRLTYRRCSRAGACVWELATTGRSSEEFD